MNHHARRKLICQIGPRLIGTCLMVALLLTCASNAVGQGNLCDPNKVITAEACSKCHGNEVQVWKTTPHFKTFKELSRNPEAKAICSKMGLTSVKRSGICVDCHFTLQDQDGKEKPVSGISCESCHGAAEDWVELHNDYGGPAASKESETEEHRIERLNASIEYGMKNTQDLYLIATSCYSCHTVPNEELVNIGGHTAGSENFELVRWSQGTIRHNFLRTNGEYNALSEPERLRVMYVVGLVADLEFSTRATAKATEKSRFGLTVAQRAADAAVKLYELQQKLNDENIEDALRAFAKADLRTNNSDSLNEIADAIQMSGRLFVQCADGSSLTVVDQYLPTEAELK